MLSVRDSESVLSSSELSFMFYTGHLLTKRLPCLFTLTQHALALLAGWFGGPSKLTKLIGFECPLRVKRNCPLSKKI